VTPTRVIYRYRLPISDFAHAAIPEGGEVLAVGPPRDDTNQLDLWAEVDPDAPVELRAFHIVGTGHALDIDPGRYVGTVVTHQGALVWHVFDVGIAT
jgi:hypothetical protein